MTRSFTTSVGSFSTPAANASADPCTSALITKANSLTRQLSRPLFPGPILRDLTGDTFVPDRLKDIAGRRHARQTDNSDGNRRTGVLHFRTGVRQQCPHSPAEDPDNECITHMERAALDQHRCQWAPSPFKSRLNHSSFGQSMRISFQFQYLGLE